MCFLVGFTEELLSSWLQCPVSLEIQTVADLKDGIFKYIQEYTFDSERVFICTLFKNANYFVISNF